MPLLDCLVTERNFEIDTHQEGGSINFADIHYMGGQAYDQFDSADYTCP